MSRKENTQNPYSFYDAEQKASVSGMTLAEQVMNLEMEFETSKAKTNVLERAAMLHDAILKEATFKDGIEGQYGRNDFTVLDMNLRRPTFNTFAFEHVPFIYGGGAVETDKGFLLKPQPRSGRLGSGNSNDINLVEVSSQTVESPILPIKLGLEVGWVDQLKYDHINFDIIAAKHEAVRMSYAIEVDLFAFVGHRGINGTAVDGAKMARGLLNLDNKQAVHVNIETKTYSVPLVHKKFESMTTDELIEVISTEYIEYAEKVSFKREFLPNKWLVSPDILAKWSKVAANSVNGSVNVSQLKYLKEALNELSYANNGPEMTIEALPYLAASTKKIGFDPLLKCPGVNNTGRTLLYRQDPYILRTRLALDLTPGALVMDPVNQKLRRNYISFIGTPLLFYPGQYRYIDNGTTA